MRSSYGREIHKTSFKAVTIVKIQLIRISHLSDVFIIYLTLFELLVFLLSAYNDPAQPMFSVNVAVTPSHLLNCNYSLSIKY